MYIAVKLNPNAFLFYASVRSCVNCVYIFYDEAMKLFEEEQELAKSARKDESTIARCRQGSL